jgi:hypothetical protein
VTDTRAESPINVLVLIIVTSRILARVPGCSKPMG